MVTMMMFVSNKHVLVLLGWATALSSLLTTTSAFVLKPASVLPQHDPIAFLPSTTTRPVSVLQPQLQAHAAPDRQEQNNDFDGEENTSLSRRDVFSQAVTAAACFGIASSSYPLQALAAEGIGSSPDSPVVVLGAGGKVGKLCTQLLAKQGLYTRAVTRDGRKTLSDDSSYVTYAAGDVSKYDSLSEAVKSASGVVFAASASGKNKGGDPARVDYLGAYNTAKACLEANVPKLVLISAGTATRPDSAGFKATNFFVKYVYGDKIMDYKIAGEAAMRDLYAQANKPACGYTVVRPGGLSDKASAGSSKVHVSQGDVYSSEVTREDVALVTVAALVKGKATNDVTFELNQNEGLGKAMSSLPDLPQELVHAGASSYGALLDGLLTDEEMKKKYPDLINDFRGDGIEPVSKLA